MRIHDMLPGARLRQVERVAVAAPPERAWATVRNLDIFRVPAFRWLVALRVLPDRLRGKGAPVASRSRLDDLVEGGGFMRLAEEPGREVVIGAIGKFWKPSIEWARRSPAEFASFDEPGWGKLAWNLRVDPRDGGSWITCEVRVTATDDDSWRRFRRYWWLIGPFSLAVRKALLGSLEDELGEARRESLPGDDLVPGAGFERTHAAVIDAPPARLWPWLVQMGARRAGWYSIDWLDNRGQPSATRIIPELQKLAVGDILPWLPRAKDGARVETIDVERALVLSGTAASKAGVVYYPMSWAFALAPIGDDATELRVRVRGASQPGLKAAVRTAVVAAMHEVMQRAQLHNLKKRAEATPTA